MSWFERLVGCREESPDSVRGHLELEGTRLRSKVNGSTWQCGRLETPTLGQLRQRAALLPRASSATTICEVVVDVQSLHRDAENTGALFQVASQFNLLEMTSPARTPEDGIGIYEFDRTQGPACAIACGAGTIYRNYFVPVNRRIGQTFDNQIDCLADMGARLGNEQNRLWRMTNGYALPGRDGLTAINQRLQHLDELQRDELRAALRIGLQLDAQVTLAGESHLVSQAFCSAMPVAYTQHPIDLWTRFAVLILEAAYEATICAAIVNAARTENNRLYLTLLGGGAFGNELTWILDAIQRAVLTNADCGLAISIVSYGQSKPSVHRLVQLLTSRLSGS